jgi:hypothetical protein
MYCNYCGKSMQEDVNVYIQPMSISRTLNGKPKRPVKTQSASTACSQMLRTGNGESRTTA